jgi:hypothetical protein
LWWLRKDNKGEENGENPSEGEEHSESDDSTLPFTEDFPRIFFLCLLERRKSSLGLPIPKLKEDDPPPIMLEKKLP